MKRLQVGQVAAHWGWTTVEVNVSIEELLAIELNAVRDTDVTHGAARTGGMNRLQVAMEFTTSSRHCGVRKSLERGIEPDDVATYVFPKTWPNDREQRVRIIGGWYANGNVIEETVLKNAIK
jgi:hypothetical protein